MKLNTVCYGTMNIQRRKKYINILCHVKKRNSGLDTAKTRYLRTLIHYKVAQQSELINIQPDLNYIDCF